MRNMVVGAIGARTTAFKTVRIDELALQRHGITMETLDLSDVFARMEALKPSDRKVKAKAERLKDYASWHGRARERPSRSSRGWAWCWTTSSTSTAWTPWPSAAGSRCSSRLGISPCVLLSEMNDRGIPAACEVDVGNAVTMRALSLASGNVGDLPGLEQQLRRRRDKCILFHCGPVPQTMMTGKGRIADHAILANAVGQGCGFGCNAGRIAPTPFTFGSLLPRTAS